MNSKSIVTFTLLAFVVYLAATGRLANIMTIVSNGKVVETSNTTTGNTEATGNLPTQVQPTGPGGDPGPTPPTSKPIPIGPRPPQGRGGGVGPVGPTGP